MEGGHDEESEIRRKNDGRMERTATEPGQIKKMEREKKKDKALKMILNMKSTFSLCLRLVRTRTRSRTRQPLTLPVLIT